MQKTLRERGLVYVYTTSGPQPISWTPLLQAQQSKEKHKQMCT